MKSILTAILGLLVLAAPALAQDIKIGDTELDVRKNVPGYQGAINTGGAKTMYFKTGTVTFVDGKVTKINLRQPKKAVTSLDGLIKDPAVDQAIRKTLHRQGGELTEKNLLALRKLAIDTSTKRHLRANTLAGLEKAVRIYDLKLGNNTLTNITALSSLKSLRTLNFNGGIGSTNRSSLIKDYSPLADLTNLTRLYLSNHELGDLTHLMGLSNLRELAVVNCGISDLTPLVPLAKNLEKLILSGNNISNLGPLAELKNLKILWLNGNSIEDVSPLKELENLHTLKLDKNPLSDIEPLGSLLKLTSVSLDGTQIEEINSVAGLPTIRSLSIMDTKLDIAADSPIRTLVSHLVRRRFVAVRFPAPPPPEEKKDDKASGDKEDTEDGKDGDEK